MSQSSDSTCTRQFDIPRATTAQPFHHKGSLKEDECLISSDTRQSLQPGQYKLQNFYECGCLPQQPATVALSQPITQYRDGYGSVGQRGCLVNNDSKMRNGSQLTRDKGPQQLFERPFLTVPYMGRGLGDPCSEKSLKEGVATYQNKQCNTLAGVTISNHFTPLIDCIKNTIQDPIHIVPEANKEDWIRGGYPSRQWIRNVWYCRRCQSTDFCRCHQKCINCPGDESRV
jgi:hypothetical protein